MRLYIDFKKIKDAPIEEAYFSDKKRFNNFKNELIYGNPTTYLISGYRGVGKTSFVKALRKEVTKELEEIKNVNTAEKNVERKKVFIHLNIGKYNGFSNILRNLIREVYWAITSSKECKDILERDPQLFVEIKLIYERTFENIEAKDTQIELDETIKSYVMSTDFRQLLLRIIIILSGSISLINFLKNNNWKSYVFSLILCIIFIFRFEYSKNKKKSKTIELNRTTFYDDEVAEFQLTRIIKKLYTSGIEIIFIIDELDKIEKEEEIVGLISELKPLMLSGYSNYLLVSGQKMLYRYLMADVLDNNVFSSIFSRNIHIPLLSRTGFEEYFVSLTGEPIQEDIVKQYLDSNILLSNRILRKFISLIRNDIEFDDKGKSYIEIGRDNKVLTTNAKISEILYEVEKEINDKTKDSLEEGIRDFLISNLYITIKNMKRIRPLSFEIEDILKSKSFKDDEFASIYINYLKENAQLIINKMLEVKLLEVVDNDEETNEDLNLNNVRYRWTENAVFDKQINKYGYLEEFIKFEAWLRDISNQLVNASIIKKQKYSDFRSLTGIFKMLIEDEIISKELYKDFKYLQKIRNNIVHGEELNDLEKEQLITFNNDLKKIKGIVFEQVMMSVVKKVNKNPDIFSNQLHYPVDLIIEGVALAFKYFEHKVSILRSLEKLTKSEYLVNIREFRLVIFYDGSEDVNVIYKEVKTIWGDNIKIKLIVYKDIKLAELIEFLKVTKD